MMFKLVLLATLTVMVLARHEDCTEDIDCTCKQAHHVPECHVTDSGNSFCKCSDTSDDDDTDIETTNDDDTDDEETDDDDDLETRTVHLYCMDDDDCVEECPGPSDGTCRIGDNNGHHHCICPDGSHAG